MWRIFSNGNFFLLNYFLEFKKLSFSLGGGKNPKHYFSVIWHGRNFKIIILICFGFLTNFSLSFTLLFVKHWTGNTGHCVTGTVSLVIRNLCRILPCICVGSFLAFVLDPSLHLCRKFLKNFSPIWKLMWYDQ